MGGIGVCGCGHEGRTLMLRYSRTWNTASATCTRSPCSYCDAQHFVNSKQSGVSRHVSVDVPAAAQLRHGPQGSVREAPAPPPHTTTTTQPSQQACYLCLLGRLTTETEIHISTYLGRYLPFFDVPYTLCISSYDCKDVDHYNSRPLFPQHSYLLRSDIFFNPHSLQETSRQLIVAMLHSVDASNLLLR